MRRFLIAMALVAGCTNNQHAQQVLSRSGYTEIEMTGYRMWDCSDDDTVHDGFRAKGPTGQVITGVVCCGLWAKNCTVRID